MYEISQKKLNGRNKWIYLRQQSDSVCVVFFRRGTLKPLRSKTKTISGASAHNGIILLLVPCHMFARVLGSGSQQVQSKSLAGTRRIQSLENRGATDTLASDICDIYIEIDPS